ncbi:MAG: VTT domain-containing protein [bacterium]
MELILFILVCILQPICWPLPEMTTVLYGVTVYGQLKGFIISYIGILFGIVLMYKLSFYMSDKHLKKFRSKKEFKKFQNYMQKNEILTIGVLLILPILPDEVICIGAAILGIKLKVLLTIALFSKFISIGIIAYAETIANYFEISNILVVIIELIIVVIISIIYKKIKK